MDTKKFFQYILMGAFIFLILLAFGLFVLVKQKPPESGKNSITGTLLVWGTLPQEAVNQGFSNLLTANRDLHINYNQISAQNFDSVFVNALAAGGGPDIIIISTDDILKQLPRIVTLPETSYSSNQFKTNFSEAAGSFLLPWGVVALPIAVDPLVIYYNKDILSTSYFAKPAETWEELEKQLPSLTSVDSVTGTVDTAGIALGAYKNITGPDDIISSLLMQSGGKISGFDANGQLTSYFTENSTSGSRQPAILDALNFFLSFSDPSTTRYSWNASSKNARDMFIGGRAAYYIGYGSEYSFIQKKKP